MRRWKSWAAGFATLAMVATAVSAPSGVGAAAGGGSFYRYTGTTPLARYAPGAVLKTRTVSYHLAGVATPVSVVQLLYRSTGALGQPIANVTSVVRPPVPSATPRVVAYQSAYDSLSANDEPSRVIAGGFSLPGAGLPTSESGIIAPFLLQGYTVVLADTESQAADFAAGPEYGRTTLDSLRATVNSPTTGVPTSAPVGLYGYSGGAIATEWAAEQAPTYAPDVNRRLVGAALGGVLVEPAHNLHYVDGTTIWSGVLPMALIGVARAYDLDLTPYLSAYGRQVYTKLQHASIGDALGHYPGLTFAQLAKPQYSRPESIAVYVRTVNKLIMGRHGTPTVPLFIGQGAGGETEGTPGDKPGIGPGDGVMIAGDVRTLARQYCAAGVPVSYTQYDALSHVTSLAPFAASATPWLESRFAGVPAPQNCADIAPGNPLTPVHVAH